MSNMKQLILIGVAVVVSGAAAVVSADHAINGTINDMDAKTSQTGSGELQNTIQVPETQQTQTVTTPEGAIQAKSTQVQGDDNTAGTSVTPADNSGSTTAQPQTPTVISHQPTYSEPVEVQFNN